jgi:hypothetical protein
MSFVQRIINAQFNLAAKANPFPGGGNQLSIAGLRVSAKITKALAPTKGTAFIQIWGMSLSEMNSLSTLGKIYQQIPKNTITLMAGDTSMGAALPTVYYGIVLQAWIETSRAPDISFNIEALTLGNEAARNVNPISNKGQIDGAQVMEQIAGIMGCTFDNSAGASAMLFNPYFWGSPYSQAQQCANACGFDWCVDDKTLTISPKGKGTSPANPVVVSPKLGTLVGYPSFTRDGIKLKTPFNPNFRLLQQFTVADSQLSPANGNAWRVMAVDHDIEALVPNGHWFSTVAAWNASLTAQPPRPLVP